VSGRRGDQHLVRAKLREAQRQAEAARVRAERARAHAADATERMYEAKREAAAGQEVHLLVFKVDDEIRVGGIYTSRDLADAAVELAPFPYYKIYPFVLDTHQFVEAHVNRMEPAS